MVQLSPPTPADTGPLLDAPQGDDREGQREAFDVNASREAPSFELADPLLAGVPFN
jgi:hypothetical protein